MSKQTSFGRTSMANLTLDQLKIGQRARVVQLSASSDVRHRLMEMGLLRGAGVELIRFAPMGDPIDIEVRGYQLSLRKADAKFVEITLSDDATSASPEAIRSAAESE